MATLPFRPPQFSDDVAWLPRWLQPNQSPSASQDVANEEFFRHSLQNVDPCQGENEQIKELSLSNNKEGRYNICHLYLSGDESTPVSLIPSCEKIFHFNLHLSTDQTSSFISDPLLDISVDDKRKSTPALVDTKRKSLGYMDHDSTIVPLPSREKLSRGLGDHTPSSNDAEMNTLEMLNRECAECDDISNAVELSVAASEALVIHQVVRDGFVAGDLPTSAILEVALRVKRARIDGKKDSLCSCNEFSDTADIHSDFSDSDMEDAYEDVGLSVSSALQDPSRSRVQETPVSEIPEEDKEVQSKSHGEREIYLNNSLAREPGEISTETNKLKDLSAKLLYDGKLEKLCGNPPFASIFGNQLQNENLDDLQMLRPLWEEKIERSSVDGFSHQLEVISSPQSQHSRKRKREFTSTIWNSTFVDMNEMINSSSRRFKSRWFGGWTGMEGDVSSEKKSNGRLGKTIPAFFVGETSYLSESMDIIPDQNSIVHNHHHISNASQSSNHFESLSNSASEGAFINQELVKSSTSFLDPLCSMVPCSISAEIGDSVVPTNKNDVHQVLDAFKSLHTNAEIPVEVSQASSGDKDENVGKEEQDGLEPNDVPLVICRKFTSLKTYSTGVPRTSVLSFKRDSNCGNMSLRNNDMRVLSSSTKSRNDRNMTKQPPARSISNCASANSNQEDQVMRLFSVEQHMSCPSNSGKITFGKQVPMESVISCTTATTNNKENHVENASERLVQDHFENNVENGGELHVHLEGIPASPLVLCRRTRRFIAPSLHINDASTTDVLEDQALLNNKICLDKNFSLDQFSNFPESVVPARKRVRFSDVDIKLQMSQGQLKKNLRTIPTCEARSSCRLEVRPENCNQEQGTASQEVKERLTKCCIKGRKRTIFQGLEFLLTGFSKKKEKEIEGLLRKHGGMVLFDIPAIPHPRRRQLSRFNPERLPVVLSTKKFQTTRFLYGCAVNAFMLKVSWAYDSIRTGSVLPPDKYLIISNQRNRMLDQIGKSFVQNDNDYIFDKVGIMLHGTHTFCTKLAKVIKHGRGHVYKSLQWLVQSLEKKKISIGAIVAEDENRATRHLKKCASEQKIAVVPARWIINSLYEGKLLPINQNYHSSNQREIRVPEVSVLQDWSQEI